MALKRKGFRSYTFMRRKPTLILAAGALALALQAAYAHSKPLVTMGGFLFGPPHNAQQQAFNGYYDGHLDAYYNTDDSKKSQAKAFHVNWAPLLAHSYPNATSPEYFVHGAAANGQLVVFGSEPGGTDYSPLWQEVIVTWKSAKPVLLTSDNQIFALQKKNKLTLKDTNVVLNAPIVKVKVKR
jgi:hypothetical protein